MRTVSTTEMPLVCTDCQSEMVPISGVIPDKGRHCPKCNVDYILFEVDPQAQKFDNGKVPLQLMSTVALNKIAEVLAHGAQKYSANQWRTGMDWSRLIGAALRHITAFNNGEDLDPESGLSHLAHAGCCIMFLLEYEDTRCDFDDRYRPSMGEMRPGSLYPLGEELRRLSIEPATWRGKSAQALRLLGEPGETLEDTYTRLYEREVNPDGA